MMIEKMIALDVVGRSEILANGEVSFSGLHTNGATLILDHYKIYLTKEERQQLKELL